jgi:osmotically-inducible protein OsmY
MTTSEDSIVKQVRAVLENEPRVNLHRYPVGVSVSAGGVVLEGEVESVAAKKRAMRVAAAIEGVRGVVDRLHVAPAERRSDGEIRDALCAFLLAEAEFRDCSMKVQVKGRAETLRDLPGTGAGSIEVAIEDGVVTIEGAVISLSHKRLVGVLAWWTPGCRDVINSLRVEPPEEDNDGEVIDALGLVYEIDPVVRHDQITVICHGGVVTLSGAVPSEEERERAELDAWALFAVDEVVNHIEVRHLG